MPSFKASDLDKLVFDDRKLIQLETLRGCTMLVPRDQASVALRIRTHTFTELSKQARQQMPVNESEMEKLKAAILKALHASPKTSDQLLHMIPGNLVRDFGPELKRIGGREYTCARSGKGESRGRERSTFAARRLSRQFEDVKDSYSRLASRLEYQRESFSCKSLDRS